MVYLLKDISTSVRTTILERERDREVKRQLPRRIVTLHSRHVGFQHLSEKTSFKKENFGSRTWWKLISQQVFEQGG